MAENAHSAPPTSPPILAEVEVTRRVVLLADLQAALAVVEIHSVVARNHRLVLLYNRAPCGPSGPTDPQLHVFAPDSTDIVTTDGSTYNLASGGQCPAGEPAAAAAAAARIRRCERAAPRA